jgi:RNA polymerase sigma-70 factor (ECF subfamily)
MKIAVRMLGNADEAAEAVQIGFVNAYLNIGRLKRPERFGAWLLRIVTNAAINQLREIKRRGRLAEVVDCRREIEDVRSSEGTDNIGDLKEAVSRAMVRLSRKEAQAISLFGFEDMSHSEVAEVMGCSVGAVRWHVFRARKKLKVLLKEYL